MLWTTHRDEDTHLQTRTYSVSRKLARNTDMGMSVTGSSWKLRSGLSAPPNAPLCAEDDALGLILYVTFWGRSLKNPRTWANLFLLLFALFRLCDFKKKRYFLWCITSDKEFFLLLFVLIINISQYISYIFFFKQRFIIAFNTIFSW